VSVRFQPFEDLKKREKALADRHRRAERVREGERYFRLKAV
jgi:hypothetical protein